MAGEIRGYTEQVIPEKVVYTGRDTSTANTIVDNSTYEIGVEINPDLLKKSVYNEDGSINVVNEDGRSKVSVNISSKEGNQLSKQDDGLYSFLDTDDFATTEELEGAYQELQNNIDLKQDNLTAGWGIRIQKQEDDTVISVIGSGGQGTLDYRDLYYKPQINGVELDGNKTNEEIGIVIPDVSDFTTYQYVDEGLATKKDDFVIKAGQGISVDEDSSGNVTISNTQTSAEWGNIQGNILEQTDLQSELNNKVDKVTGYGLSQNNFSDLLKSKLDSIESGAQINVQADWEESDPDSDSFILNKPSINNGTLTIQVNSDTIDTFTANDSNDVTVNLSVPTDTGDLTNGAGYITCGTVSQPTFTGDESTITLTGTPTGTVEISTGSDSSSYTPSGEISTPVFTGTQGSISVSGIPTGNISFDIGSGNVNYTPAGTVSTPNFTGSTGEVSVAGTPTGNVIITSTELSSGDEPTYTPEGTISINPVVELNTTTVKPVSSVGSLAQCSMPTLSFDPGTDLDDNLVISWTNGSYVQGTLPSLGEDVTVATGVKTVSASGTFTGEGTKLNATFTGNSLLSTGSFTPEGSVSQPTFNGTGVDLEASFTGTSFESTGTYTPTGIISKPTFTGTEVELVGSFTGDTLELSNTYTPSGTVSQPEFIGN